MIQLIHSIPITEDAQPFGAAAKLCDLAAWGFTEEEYIFTGTANVYGRAADGGKEILAGDAPYTSRFLLRRPADPEKFSGTIIVEIMNATPGFDLDRSWILTRKEILREGHAYVGLMSKPLVIRTMRQFDKIRYATLDWPNPIKGAPSDPAGTLPGHTSPETQTGLFWDLLMDTAKLLREGTDRNPMAALNKGRDVKLILMGWSQSGGYLIRYMKDFANAEGLGLFDGYFSMGSAGLAAPNLNQEDGTGALDQDLHFTSPVPFIDMHTESDNMGIGSHATRMENGDNYRLYDIAGPSHDTTYSEEEYYAEDTCLKAIGRSMSYCGADEHPNSFPYHFAYQAALSALVNWVRTSQAPEVVAPVQVDPDGTNSKDPDGNSIGGWRLPQIELPVCAYYGTSTASRIPGDTFTPLVYGREEPFPVEMLRERYTDLDTYEGKLTACADQCVARGLLLPADREECIARAMDKAREYGLTDPTPHAPRQ